MFSFPVPLTCALSFVVISIALHGMNTTAESNPPFPPVQGISDRSPFDLLSRGHKQLDPLLKMVLVMDQYCGKICNITLRLDDRTRFNTLCALCYCDDDCFMYGDCCPDKYVQDNRTRAPSMDMECVGHNLKDSFAPWYYMIQSCPQSTHDDVLVAGCLSNSMSSMTQVIPVTDQAENIIYKNRYCAECNGASPVIPWSIKIDCSNYSFFASAESYSHLYQIGLKSDNCSVILNTPNGISSPRRCSPYSDTMIDKCNVTGKWRHFEEMVVEACSKFFYPVKKGNYKNVFCYVCNVDLPWYHIMTETETEGKINGFSLTALLDFDDSETSKTQAQPRCPAKEFYDSYSGNCRKIMCPLGKVVQGKECTSLLQASYYFRYVICIDITARAPIYDALEMLDIIFLVVSEQLNNILFQHQLTLSEFKLIPVHSKCENNTIVVRYAMKVRVYAEDAIRDNLENTLSAAFNNDMFSSVWAIRNQTIELSISDHCSSRYNILRDLSVICEKLIFKFISKEGNHLHLDYITDDLEENEKDINNFYADLIVGDLLWCAQVELNSTEYLLDRNSPAIVLAATNETLTQLEYEMTDRRTVKVCLSHLQNELMENMNIVTLSVSSSTTGLVSLVCTCISLTFLILSVIVYIVIPNLRTSVSKYNLTLALNLIAAQTLFEFGAEQIQFPITCQVIGILAHYFWLSSVFWMNACTLNLFYKICYPFKSRVQSEMKVFLCLCLYSFISPGLIVIITALSNYFVLGVSGYGHGICYLSNVSSRKYGFAVPIGILVCTNILLFIYTFITICRLPKLKSTSDNKVSLIMCVNLSTITGASWVFGYIYEASGFIGFAYCFLIFLGTIGLFLFLSFFTVPLRKIMRCNCCSESLNGSPSTSTAMVNISTEGTGHI